MVSVFQRSFGISKLLAETIVVTDRVESGIEKTRQESISALQNPNNKFCLVSVIYKIAGLLVLAMICSCSVDDPKAELLSLSINARNNNIDIDSHATIEGLDVAIFVPPGILETSFVVDFELSENATAFINGRRINGASALVDFSKSVYMTIQSVDGITNSYTVNLESDFVNLNNAISNVLDLNEIPGAQLAIVKDEKLVYLKAFGLADVENQTAVDNTSLFRIASISKPITALGILNLVERGMLNLDDQVFGDNGILGNTYGTIPYASGIEDITVDHLLDHKAGGWSKNQNDPMDADNTWSHAEIIDHTLDNDPLKYDPGEVSVYSNFGYCLLGRIIEKVSGRNYADFIMDNILNPAGVAEMKIAQSLHEEKWPKEVSYYNNSSAIDPYSLNMPRRDANGGWVASASALVKLLTHIDLNKDTPDIILSSTLDEMYFKRSTWWHSGVLPGTCTILSKYNSEIGYAILTNGSTAPYSLATEDLYNALDQSLQDREFWPSYDLFE